MRIKGATCLIVSLLLGLTILIGKTQAREPASSLRPPDSTLDEDDDIYEQLSHRHSPHSPPNASESRLFDLTFIRDSLVQRLSSSKAKSEQEDNELAPTREGAKANSSNLSPVILVPGYGGSRLEAKWNRSETEHYVCQAQSDWTNIWIDLKQLLPYFLDCLIGMLRLEFNPTTNTTHNAQGVQIRVRNPDDIATVEYLNDIRIPTFGYFDSIIRRLTRYVGYERNQNIRAAPYDFRLAPNELGSYFEKLNQTCQQMFEDSGEEPITFICHSMGCNNIYYFLRQQSQEWKDKHIKRVISIAAPWGGAISALRAVAFGDNLGLPLLFDETKLNKVQRSLPSTIYLLPNKQVFGGVPLITAHSRGANGNETLDVYYADDYERFFSRIKHPTGYKMWQQTKDLLGNLEAPGVELWCLYANGEPTLGRMVFQGTFPESEEEDLYDDGDGTVTIQSSTFCYQWSNEQVQPIHLKAFQNDHIKIMKDSSLMNTIQNILLEDEFLHERDDNEMSNEIL